MIAPQGAEYASQYRPFRAFHYDLVLFPRALPLAFLSFPFGENPLSMLEKPVTLVFQCAATADLLPLLHLGDKENLNYKVRNNPLHFLIPQPWRRLKAGMVASVVQYKL